MLLFRLKNCFQFCIVERVTIRGVVKQKSGLTVTIVVIIIVLAIVGGIGYVVSRYFSDNNDAPLIESSATDDNGTVINGVATGRF